MGSRAAGQGDQSLAPGRIRIGARASGQGRGRDDVGRVGVACLQDDPLLEALEEDLVGLRARTARE